MFGIDKAFHLHEYVGEPAVGMKWRISFLWESRELLSFLFMSGTDTYHKDNNRSFSLRYDLDDGFPTVVL